MSAAIPAATVVLLRDAPALEVLMLHKSSHVAFGGMWVFPGGQVDAEDYPPDHDPDAAARRAAARETREEAGILAPPDDFVWFAHWTPPASTARRFATWFFAAAAGADHTVQIDGGEIQNHAWLEPALALERQAAGEIDLAPPTWITLHQLGRYPDTATALARLQALPAKIFETHIARRSDGVRVAMWHGDAGYEDWNADAPGARHRLVLCQGGFQLENDVEAY